MRPFFVLCVAVILILLVVTPTTSQSQMLPPPSPAVYLPLIAHAPRITIANLSIFGTSQYSWGGVGEVINWEPSQAMSVTLEVQSGYSSSTSTHLLQPEFAVTLPNQPNPFRFGGVNATPFRHVTIRAVEPVDGGNYRRLTVVLTRLTCPGQFYYSGMVEGLVRNDSTVPVHDIRAVIWGNGGSGRHDLPTNLLPGEERPITVGNLAICQREAPDLPRSGITLEDFQGAAQGRVDGKVR